MDVIGMRHKWRWTRRWLPTAAAAAAAMAAAAAAARGKVVNARYYFRGFDIIVMGTVSRVQIRRVCESSTKG